MRRLLWGSGTAVVLVAILPQLVAWSPLRHDLPRVRLRGFEGRIRVGQASMSWLRPVELADVELCAPDGKPFIHIDRVIEQRSLATMAFRRGEPADVRLVRPVLMLELTPEGSNIADAMAPVIEYRRRHPSRSKERSVEVDDAVLHVTDAATGRHVEWNSIALRVHSLPGGPEVNSLNLTARLAGAELAGPLEVEYTWPPAAGAAAPEGARGLDSRVSIRTSELPLGCLAPFLGRIAPDLELAGSLSTDVQVQFGGEGSESARPFQVAGRLAVQQLEIACPSRLGNDRPALGTLRLEAKAESDGALCHVDQFLAESDVGKISAGGRFPLNRAEEAPGTGGRRAAGGPEFTLRGNIDLVRLSRLVPQTLELREGAELTEGEITLDVSSRIREEHWRWEGRLETGRLAAKVGGDEVVWDQPVRLTFALAEGADRIEIETLTCESDVIQASGRGTSDDAHVEVRFDLDRLAARAAQFVDLAGRQFAGEARLTADLKRDADRSLAIALNGTVQNLALRLEPAGPEFHEEKIELAASGAWNRDERRVSLPELRLESAAATVLGRDLLFVRHENGLPELSGKLTIDTDLDRFNAPDLPAGERPWTGKVKGEIEFTREGDETAGRWQVAIDDLSVRRKSTKMVERRRGEVEEVRPEPPAVLAPRPAPGVPLDKRARRALEKAEKDAKKEMKRREKEARKRAEEIVLVPETEWQTLWSDPHIMLSGEALLDRAHDRIELPSIKAVAGGIRLTAGGTVADASGRVVVDLAGETDYDLEQLLARLDRNVSRHVRISGEEKRRFSLKGPLRNGSAGTAEAESAPSFVLAGADADAQRGGGDRVRPAEHLARANRAPFVPRDLTGEAASGWKAADLFGLKAGPVEFDVRLADGVLAMQPVAMDLSGGKLHLAPRVLLDQRPATIAFPAGPMIENVELSQDLCDTWLRYIAPILSEATRVEGRFSLDLNETRLPAGDMAAGDLSGRLRIERAQVLPGPLFAELAVFIGEIESAVTRSAPSDLIGLDKPFVRIEQQEVEFRLEDRRLHSSALAFNVRNVPVTTRGSVGVDQSLDLVAEISIPPEWTRKVSFLARLEGKALVLPIRGTLRHPRLDAGGIGRFWEQFGRETLDGLLNGTLPRLFDR